MDNAHRPDEEKYWDFIRLAMMSTANTCVTPLQDYLGLDAEARINKPSTLGGNWEWRMDKDMFTDEMVQKIYGLTKLSCRLSEEKAKEEQEKLEERKRQEARKKAAEEAENRKGQKAQKKEAEEAENRKDQKA